MCTPVNARIRCATCGIPIPDPGEQPDPAALLCDKCYEAVATDALPDAMITEGEKQ